MDAAHLQPEADEASRLKCLASLDILDSPPDPVLDALTRTLAAQLDCPIALISLIDERRQWFKSRHGLATTETPREWSFCAHAVAAGQMLEITDAAADLRFAASPLVTGAPHIRFYAGQPLFVNGQAIGSLCAIDRKPRQLSPRERLLLRDLAHVAEASIERSAAQQRHAAGELRLGDMLRAASDFVWEVDAERRFTWLSAGVEAVLGVPAAALVGQPLWNPLVLDAMGHALPGRPSLHQSLGRGGEPVRLVIELPVASGASLPLLLSAVAVHNAAGHVIAWRGTAQDMRVLLEGSRRSRELELQLSSIAAQLPGAIFMLEQSSDGRLRVPYASAGLARVFGQPPSAVADDAMALFAQVAAPQREALLADLQRSAERDEIWTFECPVKRPSASDRWVGGRATPQRLADGRRVWYGYAADFTERRAAARVVADAQRRLQQALDIGRLGVLVFDRAAGTVELDALARQIHGAAALAAEPAARPLAEWLAQIDADDRETVAAALAGARRLATPAVLSYRLADAANPAQVELRVERTGAKRLIGLCRDVTEQERAARAQRERLRLETERRLQSDFLSRVSHELRTPMNAIIGFVDLMRTDVATPLAPLHLEWSQHVMSAGQHLMTLINDLLDLTRIDSGHQTLKLEALRVDRMLKSSQALLEPLALRNRSVLAAPGGDSTLRVLADRRALGQVLLNLIGNAIKFNRDGGEVSCSVSATGTRCLIRIGDQGPGIAHAQRDKLFQPFERLGRTHGTNEGSGLGLAITRRLVEAMQGSVWAEFPHAGGTCMVIDLPLADAPVEAAQPEAGPRRAIYVEDDPAHATVLQAMFEMRADWTVDVVASADELHHALRSSTFDLALLNIDRGAVSGLDLVRALRADPSTQALTCVALSADGLEEQIADALRAGFDDCWTQPIQIDELHRQLDSLPRRQSPSPRAR